MFKMKLSGGFVLVQTKRREYIADGLTVYRYDMD